MNDDIMLAIFLTLKDKSCKKKTDMKMVIEEYLDWIRYSQNRYDKDYREYYMSLETVQALYVLHKEDEAKNLIDTLIRQFMQ